MASEKKILIVDDEREVLDFLTLFFEKQGYRVLKALDGASAMQQAMQNKPDLMILDILMPAGSGITVYTRMKQSILTQKIPIIFLTAMPVENASGKLPAEANPIIFPKPPDMENILSTVENILSGGTAQAPLET